MSFAVTVRLYMKILLSKFKNPPFGGFYLSSADPLVGKIGQNML